MAPGPALEGHCRLSPRPTAHLHTVIADAAGELAARHGSRNVLVLKRHPQGVSAVQETLAATTEEPIAPPVESLPEHASKTLEANDPALDRLEYEERIELISLVIAGAKREIPDYLERAATQDSFARDVGRLLLEATRQRLDGDDLPAPEQFDSPDADGECATGQAIARESLAFLYAMNDRFHRELADRGYVERAQVVPRAVDALEASEGLRERVTAGVDAVLAIEFEEFRALDRAYLAALTTDCELVCLGERHASVERTAVEPGRIDHLVDPTLTVDPTRLSGATGAPSEPPHDAITRFLATGEQPVAPEDGPVGTAYRLRTATPRAQSRAVAREIQSLTDRPGWRPAAVAVAAPSVERVPELRRQLRAAGVPTATIGTPSLAENAAVAELYAVVTCHAARERDRRQPAGQVADPDVADRLEAARARLAARVDDPSLLDRTADPSVVRSLEQWIQASVLKDRIASEESWIDAREQFAGVRRVLDVARFVEETDLVGPDWGGLRRMLERTIRYDAPYVHAVEADPPRGGVTVCPIDHLKYDRYRAVFLVDVTDDIYPGQCDPTPLVPTAWLRGLAGVPFVTDPSAETVAETFATVDPAAVGDTLTAFHVARSRRRLALGARAATETLYCCSYRRGDRGLRRTYDESRFLRLVAATPGLELQPVCERTRATIEGREPALEALLAQPRGELERVLRAASTGGSADLGATETLLQEIAVVLADPSVDDTVKTAVRTQFAFAAGEVFPDD